jgi:hypothetical protein
LFIWVLIATNFISDFYRDRLWMITQRLPLDELILSLLLSLRQLITACLDFVDLLYQFDKVLSFQSSLRAVDEFETIAGRLKHF